MDSIKNFFVKPDMGMFLLRLFIGLATLAQGVVLLRAGSETWEGLGSAMTHFGIHWGLVYWGFAAAFVQAVGPLFFMVGYFFRTACFFLFSVMLVAFLFHYFQGDPLLAVGAHAGKMAALFFCLMFTGPGRYAIKE